MSRTKQSEFASSPVKFKLEWVGHEEGGYFSVWDRDKKEEIHLPLPLRFAYLDTKKAVAGYYEAQQRSFFSNEIRNTRSQEFDVRYFKNGNTHPVAKGLWADIKGDIGNKGAKFCNVVYATLLEGGTDEVPNWSLIKLPLVGAAGSEWIDLDIKDGESFSVVRFEDRKKGRTDYRAPIFEKIEITEEEDAVACEQDEELQAYFEALKEPKKEATTEESTANEPVPPVEYEDDIPF